MSQLASITHVAPDVAYALMEKYQADPSPNKVDLSPGFYRDEDGKPWVLPSVQKAKQVMHNDSTANHECSPILGHTALIAAAQKLVFNVPSDEASTIATIQTVAGTGANHLGALFLAKATRPRTVWMSNPSWVNHQEIWKLVDASIEQEPYPYFDKKHFVIDFGGMVATLSSKTAPGDVVVLHGCAHNPTGIDLSKDQWKTVAKICEEKRLIPFFDLAYQGFATGDLDEDSWAIRYFFRNTSLDVFVAQSFSKNFGLYGERVGALHVVCRAQETRLKVANRLTRLARAEITTSPINGARIVSTILSDDGLMQQWQQDLDHMSGRLKSMRQRLVEELKARKTPGCWDHILTDIGMFSMTGLRIEQVTRLQETYHVYLMPSGRMSMTGLTENNVEHVAEAIHQVATMQGQD